MRRFLAAMVLSMAVSAICDAKDVTYKLTGENTKIEWTGSKPEGKHSGGFKKLTGTATQSDSGLKVDLQIDCDSLYSDDEKLTKHLLSPDLFSVKEHPKAKYKGSAVVARAYSRLGEKRYSLFNNNCEHLCTWSIDGVSHSEQVAELLLRPTLLLTTLSALLNRATEKIQRKTETLAANRRPQSTEISSVA
jgi:hypothetical protein